MNKPVLISTFDLHCEYQEYYTNTEILEAVENGEVDYGICHAAVSKKIIESNGFQLKKGTAVMRSFPALAVSDSRPDLQEKLNKTVQELAEEGVLYNLKTKWITDYTKDRSFRTVIRENRAFYLVLFMSGAILMILTVFFLDLCKQKNGIYRIHDGLSAAAESFQTGGGACEPCEIGIPVPYVP